VPQVAARETPKTRRRRARTALAAILVLIALGSCAKSSTVTAPGSFGPIPSPIFPPDNVWNTDISNLPVHSMSATWIAKVSEHGGSDNFLWAGWRYPNFGFKYQLVDRSTPRVKVKIVEQDPADSDTGIYYPFGPNTPLEVGTADFARS